MPEFLAVLIVVGLVVCPIGAVYFGIRFFLELCALLERRCCGCRTAITLHLETSGERAFLDRRCDSD